VFAHPDDDVYQIGGSLALHAGELTTTLVFCTSGDAGPITSPELATRENLGPVREREQGAAMARLGVAQTTDARFLRHPDYYLPDVSFEHLVGEIEAVLREMRPHVVVTFGPDGLTSHHDHIRAGAVCTEAFHRARGASSPDDGAFQRLYHTALIRGEVDRFYAGIAELDPRYGDEGDLFNLTGIDERNVAVSVDTTPVRAVKLAAILEHATQVCELERIPEPLRWIHLDRERFARAWPPWEPGEPVASDLFQGVR
jgi:N-acetyl-1-D-myo-inositol-2-amino-2-deoxy-alpha-D-glucopyranoside deacetylase